MIFHLQPIAWNRQEFSFAIRVNCGFSISIQGISVSVIKKHIPRSFLAGAQNIRPEPFTVQMSGQGTAGATLSLCLLFRHLIRHFPCKFPACFGTFCPFRTFFTVFSQIKIKNQIRIQLFLFLRIRILRIHPVNFPFEQLPARKFPQYFEPLQSGKVFPIQVLLSVIIGKAFKKIKGRSGQGD